MSITIEDILKSHGVGNGAGINIVKQEEEPTTGLTEGLFWHRESDGQTKMFLGGTFKDIGGGGMLLIPFFGRSTTTAVTSAVEIPVANYNPADDVLFVSQNGINITESIDYLVNRETKEITKRSGVWDVDTVFDFTILSLTKTNSSTDNVTLVQLEDHVTVAAGVETVTFSIPGFNDETDVIRVHQRNLEVFRGLDWTMNPDGSSIALGYSLDAEEEFHFTVLKKVRDQIPEGEFDGVDLINGSVGEEKISPAFSNKVNVHLEDDIQHVSPEDRSGWDAKETTDGARRKVEQSSYAVSNSGKDANGIFTTVEFRRKNGNTLAIQSVLSGGTSPLYTTRTITYYGTDGTMVEKIDAFTLSYDADGDLVSEV